jgi:hypothetical protein
MQEQRSDGARELEPAAAEPVHHAAERGAPAEGAPAQPGEQGPPRPAPAKAAGRRFVLLGAGVVVSGAAGRRGPFLPQRSVCCCRQQAARQVTERKRQEIALLVRARLKTKAALNVSFVVSDRGAC